MNIITMQTNKDYYMTLFKTDVLIAYCKPFLYAAAISLILIPSLSYSHFEWKRKHTILINQLLKLSRKYHKDLVREILRKIDSFDCVEHCDGLNALRILEKHPSTSQELKDDIQNMLIRTGIGKIKPEQGVADKSRPTNPKKSSPNHTNSSRKVGKDNYSQAEVNYPQAYTGNYGAAKNDATHCRNIVWCKQLGKMVALPEYTIHDTRMPATKPYGPPPSSSYNGKPCEPPPSYSESMDFDSKLLQYKQDFNNYRQTNHQDTHETQISFNTGFYTQKNNCALAAGLSCLISTHQVNKLLQTGLFENWFNTRYSLTNKLSPVADDEQLDSIRDMLLLGPANTILSIDEVFKKLIDLPFEIKLSTINLLESDEATPLQRLPFSSHADSMQCMEKYIQSACSRQLNMSETNKLIGVYIDSQVNALPIPPSFVFNRKNYSLESIISYSQLHFYTIIRDPGSTASLGADTDFYYMDSAALLQDGLSPEGDVLSTSVLVKLPKFGSAIKSNSWFDYATNLTISDTLLVERVQRPWDKMQLNHVTTNIRKRLSRQDSKPVFLMYQAR